MLMIIIIVVIILLIILFKLRIKKLALDHLSLFTGGLKVGKSALSLAKAKKEYNKNLRIWKIKKFLFTKILRKKYDIEKPLFYSNIPVGFDYVPLTMEHINRTKRIRYKSITWIDEASLLADSMSAFKQDGKSRQDVEDFNSVLLVFIKLYCHETHNGSLYINTQALSDLHFSFRRCMSRYIYIHSCIKWLPFVVVYRVSEMYYSEDNNSVNINNNGDILDNTKLVFMSKKIWKKYDRWAYDTFTNDLPTNDLIINGKNLVDLKSEYVLTNRKLPTINNVPTYNKPYRIKKKRFNLLKKIHFKKKGEKK